jgi:hypothetical protein
MRILCYTPVKSGQLFGRALQSILRLEWDGQLDFMFARGGNDHATGTLDQGAAYIEITRKYNEARQIVLEHGYDALFCVESDMIVPPDALTRLAALDVGVAYGLYCWRHSDMKWSAYRLVQGKLGCSLMQEPDARDYWGQVVDVAGVGTGCTLIRREVIEAIPFRVDPEGYACCDWYFAEDCQVQRVRQMCDMGVVCGHMSLKPSPRIIWPDRDALVRIEMIDPQWHQMQPGERIEIPVGMMTAVVPGKLVQNAN